MGALHSSSFITEELDGERGTILSHSFNERMTKGQHYLHMSLTYIVLEAISQGSDVKRVLTNARHTFPSRALLT